MLFENFNTRVNELLKEFTETFPVEGHSPTWQKKAGKISQCFNLPDNLSLKYSDNHLTFNFTGISLKNPQKVRYSYMLEGLDSKCLLLFHKMKLYIQGYLQENTLSKLKRSTRMEIGTQLLQYSAS